MTAIMEQTGPILSVAMPCYNVSAYLERGLGSFDDDRLEGRVEVLIVNDGSTDDTPALARGYCQRRPGVFKLIDKPNGGHGSAINAGLAQAQGTYFRVVDGDDWVDADQLCALLDHLESASADLVVDVKTEVDMATMSPTVFELAPELVHPGARRAEELFALDAFAPFVMIHTLTCRTGYLRSIGFSLLEKTFYEDFEYVVKATLDASTVEFVDCRVYQYLVGNASQSVADESYVRRFDDHTRVCTALMELLGARGAALSPARRSYLERRCALLSNTHLNIALIFDKDRGRGLRRAREYMAYLRTSAPQVAQACRGHYRKAMILHFLGIDSQKKLDSLKR